MKQTIKNNITNIIGLILIAFNIYEFYFEEFTVTEFSIGLSIALALFLFKGTETKDWIRRILGKFSNTNNSDNNKPNK